jgi:hypothetical protein
VSGDLARYYEALVASPRQEGEDIIAWLERVCAAAIPQSDRQLPPGDRDAARDPGQEG